MESGTKRSSFESYPALSLISLMTLSKSLPYSEPLLPKMDNNAIIPGLYSHKVVLSKMNIRKHYTNIPYDY